MNDTTKSPNPITGKRMPGKRFKFRLSDFLDGEPIYLPVEMMTDNLIRELSYYDSIESYARIIVSSSPHEVTDLLFFEEEKMLRNTYISIIKQVLIRHICEHDISFFVCNYLKIKHHIIQHFDGSESFAENAKLIHRLVFGGLCSDIRDIEHIANCIKDLQLQIPCWLMPKGWHYGDITPTIQRSKERR
jgi:hypothetical protein